MQRRALLIGINTYHLLSDLKYARQDAEAVAEALQQYCGFSDDEITLMSCQATGATLGLSRFIELALENLAYCRDLELLVFGFWGHGFSPERGRRYLCGVDTLETDLPRTAVSLDVVKGRLQQVQAENTLLILDCCQNQLPGRSGSDVMTEGEEKVLAGLARDIQAAHRQEPRLGIPTVAVLNSCCEGQRAYEWETREHGVFTGHLLDGFEQGFAGVASLAAWTADQVPRTTREMLGQVQTPYITIEGKGDIPLPREVSKTRTSRPRRQQTRPLGPGRVEILKDPVLRVETTPPGATVMIDGKVRGKTPLDLVLNAGEYRIRFELDGYHPIEQRIRYDAAGDALLEMSLKERLRIKQAFFPMTAEQATEVQDAAAKAWGLPLEITNSIGMKLRLIPPGEFMMGSPETEKGRWVDEGPQHPIRITKPFYMGVFPVTQAEYERVMGTNPSRFKGSKGILGFLVDSGDRGRPVECVSWEDAVAFCLALSRQLGKAYRLPTEAEWEYACRAGSNMKWCFGDDDSLLREYAWYSENANYRTHRVGQKKPNPWGLYDVHGNVWEWCADWYKTHYYAMSPIDNPTGPDAGSYRGFRGGGWHCQASRCRASCRYGRPPGTYGAFLGFRVAETIP